MSAVVALEDMVAHLEAMVEATSAGREVQALSSWRSCRGSLVVREKETEGEVVAMEDMEEGGVVMAEDGATMWHVVGPSSRIAGWLSSRSAIRFLVSSVSLFPSRPQGRNALEPASLSADL